MARWDRTHGNELTACAEVGFAVERSDSIDEPGRITRQIVQRLVSDDNVGADLTGLNPNVFYELAIRHAIRKWAIHLYEVAAETPFDVRDIRAIRVGTGVRLATEGRARLVEALRLVKDAPEEIVETPFTEGVDLAAGGRSFRARALTHRRTSAELR